jgi:phosphatidylserine/phosphatidylglycerophosphate/cardiolipin synthase-like enzyme
MAVNSNPFANVCLCTDTKHTLSNDCFQRSDPCFAMPRHGNKVTAATTGKELFQHAAEAILGAKKFILLADWQMDYDVELTDRGSPAFSGRLSELLAKKVAEGIEVKVLLYDSVEAALYTHENHVCQNLMLLNPTADELARGAGPKRNPAGNLPVEVALQKPMTGRAFENIAFAHHQKIVVVDGTKAFIGGMDLCYGRWCDGNFDVIVDPVLHRINDMYNPGLPGGRLLTTEETRLTTPWAGGHRPSDARFGPDRPGFAPPYYIIGILMQRAKELWDKGYSIDQIVVQLDAMALPDQIADYFRNTYRRLWAILTAIDRTLKRYSNDKSDAFHDILKGDIIKGLIKSYSADFKLVSIAAKQLDKALNSALEAALDWIGEHVASVRNWFKDEMRDIADDLGDIERYARNPALLKQDGLRLWQDINDLPSQIIDNFALEEGCQPRMPWQDVHAIVEGPAALDVYRNFVRRWNVAVNRDTENGKFGIKPLTDKWLSRWGKQDAVFGDVTKHGTAGNVAVQIVRSMSASLLQAESQYASLHPVKDVGITLDKDQYANKDSGNMDGVLEAMVHAIRGAEAFIYIENQFFLSNCRKSKNYENSPTKNVIIDELAARIGVAVQLGRAFHIYVVMPVHPEGNLSSGSVAKQQYWALQTIKHGKQSLIWRVCDYIARKANSIPCSKDPSDEQIKAEVDSNSWNKYLTFLNLRSWGTTAWFERDAKGERKVSAQTLKGQFVVTEQIYVHSKLMIVDDAIVILGSANINDRSLQGNGDTEIAAVIVDNDTQLLDVGTGHPVQTRKFARELRKKLWRKHLGMDIEDKKFMRGDRPGHDNSQPPPYQDGLPYPPRLKTASVPAGIDLDKPADPKTQQAIKRLAQRNSRFYREVFRHVPTDAMKRFADTEAGWPRRLSRLALGGRVAKHYAPGDAKKLLDKVVPEDKLVTDFATVPPMLQAAYMRKAKPGEALPYKKDGDKVHDVNLAVKWLQNGIIGFWVEMPLQFGIDEHDIWLGGKTGAFMTAENERRTPPNEGVLTRADQADEAAEADA